MNLKPNILIFSVFQKNATPEVNKDIHSSVLYVLLDQKLPAMELKGRYNGTDESSILIQGFEHREVVERLCKEFGQECYLESHNDRATFLVFPDGSKKYIGVLTPVDENEAQQVGSYSYNEAVGQFYITKQ